MNRHKAGWLLALVLAFAPWATASAADEAPPEHIAAYISLIKAERAEQGGNLAEALKIYREGMEQYREVARLYPDWKTEMVRYRLAHTQNQIGRVEEELAKLEAARVAPEPTAPTTKAAVEAINESAVVESSVETSSRELELAREEISILEEAVAELEAERTGLMEKIKVLEAAQAAVPDMEQERARLNEALRLANESALAAQESGTRDAEALAALRTDLTALTGERDRVQHELVEVKKSLEKSEAVLRKMKKAETDWAKEREERTREISALQARVETLTGELAARDAAVNDAGRAQQDLRETQELLRVAQEQLSDTQEQLAAATNAAQEATSRSEVSQQVVVETRQQALALQAALDEARASLVARTEEFDSAVKRNQELDRARRDLDEERNRLLDETRKQRATLEKNEAGQVKTRDLQRALAELKDENKELRREIDGLNKTIERKIKQEDESSLQQQNLALMEELRVYRAQLAITEKRLRDLERHPTALPGF